jgi:hypothetical protein
MSCLPKTWTTNGQLDMNKFTDWLTGDIRYCSVCRRKRPCVERHYDYGIGDTDWSTECPEGHLI